MKKLVLLFCFVLAMVSVSQAQKVNEKVQIESSGSWYPGTILKVDAAKGEYFVTYEGWGDSWDEWVPISRLKDYATAVAPAPASPLTKFKVGDKVEVEYGMVPEPATVIEVGENKYHIQYDKKVFGTKWVTEREIKKL